MQGLVVLAEVAGPAAQGDGRSCRGTGGFRGFRDGTQQARGFRGYPWCMARVGVDQVGEAACLLPEPAEGEPGVRRAVSGD